MKKRSKAARLGVLALAMSLVTVCLLGGTMAKYVTTLGGNATATAAAWSFKLTDKNGNALSDLQTINLGATGVRNAYTPETIKENVIAPGTEGSFDIVLDAAGSEVGVNYTVAIEEAIESETNSDAKIPDDILFSTTEFSDQNTGSVLNKFEITDGTIAYTDTKEDMKKTITVYWKWTFDDSSDVDAKDERDTKLSGKNFKLKITATGTQVAPKETAAP